MPTILVRAQGAERHRHTLDISETQVLIAVDGLGNGAEYEHHVLMARISGTQFITLDSALALNVEDL